MQTKRQSLAETCTSTVIGFVGSWLIMYGLMHYVTDPAVTSTVVTLACTVWSIVRGYTLRRYFNRKHHAPGRP